MVTDDGRRPNHGDEPGSPVAAVTAGRDAAGTPGPPAAGTPGRFGDADSFAQLYDRHSGHLYRYACRRLGPQVAEDVVANTFLAAFARRASYDENRADARPWLFGILTREMARHRRAERTHYRTLVRASTLDAEDGPADRIAERVTAGQAQAALVSALAELRADDRNVLLLIAWGDLSYQEVATALGIPLGTVRSRLNRARGRVRAALGGSDPTREHTPDQEEATP
jgi:RNA polymerase sigma factor (sigma-70 family)